MSFRDSFELTDPRVMRAMAHPTRLAIFHVLVDGPATATECAEVVGESPSACSYHLRTLAELGFVGEVPSADGRERRWELARRSWSTKAGAEESPEFAVASNMLRESAMDLSDKTVNEYIATQSDFPPEWQEAATFLNSILYLTPEELEELGQKILDLGAPYAERAGSPEKMPEGARRVLATFRAVPYPRQGERA